MNKSSERQLIDDIIAGREEGIVTLYRQHKKNFINWAYRKFKLNEDDALDIFQDSVIALYKSIRNGQLTEITNTTRTYLYTIGKNKIISKFKRDSKQDLSFDKFDEIPEKNELELDETQVEIRNKITELLDRLGEPCYSLLKLYYYDGFSMEAIAREIGSKNANVAKAQKARCIKALKDMLGVNKNKE